jgi:hypothetical protein
MVGVNNLALVFTSHLSPVTCTWDMRHAVRQAGCTKKGEWERLNCYNIVVTVRP